MRRPPLHFPRGLKRFTNPVVGPIPLPILSGVNRGRRWSLASWGSGYGSGRREQGQMRLLDALIHEGDVVWDVGAHYGYVTLMASRRVGPRGHVYAFEPSSASRRFLRRHLSWNHVQNATVQPEALGAFDGTACFGGGETSKQHHLGARGGEEVQVRTLRSMLASGACRAPDFLKIDVEGAEGDLLSAGCGSLAPDARMLVAVHSEEAYAASVAALLKARFRLHESERLQRYRREGFWGDADLLALGPEYPGGPRDAGLLRAVGE